MTTCMIERQKPTPTSDYYLYAWMQQGERERKSKENQVRKIQYKRQDAVPTLSFCRKKRLAYTVTPGKEPAAHTRQ